VSQIEVSEVIVAKEEWEEFLSSLERLMAVHKRSLEKLRELRSRNRALRAELRSSVDLPSVNRPQTRKNQFREGDAATTCVNCGHEIERSASFCDRCGASVFKCDCGRALMPGDQFCDQCGRPFISGT